MYTHIFRGLGIGLLLLTSGVARAQIADVQSLVRAMAEQEARLYTVRASLESESQRQPRPAAEIEAILARAEAALTHAMAAEGELPFDATETRQRVLTGLRTMLEQSGTVRTTGALLYRSPYQYRHELSVSGPQGETQLLESSDGHLKTTYHAGQQTAVQRPAADDYTCPFGWLTQLLAAARSMEYRGTEDLAGRTCHVLHLTLDRSVSARLTYPGCPSVTEVTLWVDADTLAWVRLEEYGLPTLMWATREADGSLADRFLSLDGEQPELLAVTEVVSWHQDSGSGLQLPQTLHATCFSAGQATAETHTRFEYLEVNGPASLSDLDIALPSAVETETLL